MILILKQQINHITEYEKGKVGKVTECGLNCKLNFKHMLKSIECFFLII